MKFYVAGSVLNLGGRINDVQRILTKAGYELTYDWTRHGDVTSRHPGEVARIAVMEIEAVRTSDFIVVVFPGGKGTHIEIGAALALGKPVILIPDAETQLPKITDSAFYRHPGIRWIDEASWSALLGYLPHEVAHALGL